VGKFSKESNRDIEFVALLAQGAGPNICDFGFRIFDFGFGAGQVFGLTISDLFKKEHRRGFSMLENGHHLQSCLLIEKLLL
jgi:hypothetical protein